MWIPITHTKGCSSKVVVSTPLVSITFRRCAQICKKQYEYSMGLKRLSIDGKVSNKFIQKLKIKVELERLCSSKSINMPKADNDNWFFPIVIEKKITV